MATPPSTAPRFLQLSDVGVILNVSQAQAYALVRSGSLPAIKVGGRGQWRIERTELENFIRRSYSETRAFIDTHPYGSDARDEDLERELDDAAQQVLDEQPVKELRAG